MFRPFAVALVWCALVVPSAGAETVGVYDGPDLGAVALAGPDAVVLKHDYKRDRSSLIVVPRSGGAAKTVLRIDDMRDLYEVEPRRLAASPQRVALIAEIINRNGHTLEWRVYSGPPRGPITLVRSLPPTEQWEPVAVDVDGDRLLLVESRPESDGPIRAFVFDGSGAGFVPIPWARASATPRDLSGGFVAADMAGPNRVGVLDLATGAELATVPLADRERGFDLSLAPDGRVAVRTRDGVRVAGPALEPRLLSATKGLSQLHLTGQTLAAVDAKGRAVALDLAGGAPRELGPPTRVPEAGAGDATGYAFIANGCARVAALPVTSAPAPKSDPCPRTEVSLYYIASTRLRGNMIDGPVRCVAAPRGVCRGTAIAKIYEGDGKVAASGRFAIPVGKERNVKMRVTAAALKIFRKEGYGNLTMDARIPDGRVGLGGRGEGELGVSVPGRD